MIQLFYIIIKIVFDIETSNFFQEVGSNNPADLDISVVCIYEYQNDKYTAFTQEEFGKEKKL